MSICKLCKKNEATQTGSHIIPSFLMKRVDNVAGSNKRDRELGFAISGTGVKPYFGRSTPDGKLEEVFGEVTDDDIENSRSPEIIDYMLCPRCESRFSKIESAYADLLNIKQKESYYSEIDPQIAFAFWLSVVWRVSASGIHNVKFSPEKEELIRNILDIHLGDSVVELKDLSNILKENNLYYKLMRCPDYTLNNGGFVFGKNQDCEPFGMVIGEFVLFFYTRKRCRVDKKFSLFGLEDYRGNCKNNNLDQKEFVYSINESSFRKNIEKAIAYIMKERLKDLYIKIDYVTINSMGIQMKIELKNAIIADMLENNKLARRHSDKSLAISIYKILGQIGLINKG